jgi:hypothetical protein
MHTTPIHEMSFLTYAGVLPFWVCAVAQITNFSFYNLDFVFMAAAYGAVIISFLCGIHWATYLFHRNSCPRFVLLTSNIIALCAWGSLLLFVPIIQITIQIICLAVLLGIDAYCLRNAFISTGYFTLRIQATMGAALGLLCVVFFK